MGRIKTTLIKRAGEELFTNNPSKFSSDFKDNKTNLKELTEINSKKFRNIITGYITRLVKKSQETK
jgi:small subunit ribosomal protein S17e